MDKDWFASWFDSPFYHMLYKERDDNEAKQFVAKLLQYFTPARGARMLDIACGKGRFAKLLASYGHEVLGIDLSPTNIQEANKYATNSLRFSEHDMREPLEAGLYDYAFNFFTSFGYFDQEKDHIATLQSIYNSLRKGGIFLIDFMNSFKTIETLVPEETKTVDGMTFSIQRKEIEGYIVKRISFDYHQKHMEFEERVRAFHLADFRNMFEYCGFQIEEVWGDYQLNEYRQADSDRLIIVGKK